MKNLFGLFLISACLLTCSPVTAGSVAPLTPAESKLRAAYLYNFSKFIRWPKTAFANDTAPFIIGVTGGDGTLKSLSLLTLRKIGSHPIKIRPYPAESTSEKFHLLYQEKIASDNSSGRKVKAIKKTGASVDSRLLSLAIELRE